VDHINPFNGHEQNICYSFIANMVNDIVKNLHTVRHVVTRNQADGTENIKLKVKPLNGFESVI
jgi:hypothetical protein